jgi:hypothetical protein
VAGDGVGTHHYDYIVLNVLVKRVERREELTEVGEVWHAGTEIGLCY